VQGRAGEKVSTLVTSSTHSGSAPGAQATQVSLSTGVHMSQFAPPDPRRYSTITAITLFNIEF